MNDPEVISTIVDEMLTDKDIEAEFVIKAGKLAEEDSQMYKLMVLYMYFPDCDYHGILTGDNYSGRKEIISSMEDYMRKKALWGKVAP